MADAHRSMQNIPTNPASSTALFASSRPYRSSEGVVRQYDDPSCGWKQCAVLTVRQSRLREHLRRERCAARWVGPRSRRCKPRHQAGGFGSGLILQLATERTIMKHPIATAVALAALAATPAGAESTQISQNGSRPSAKGSAQYFTGSAIVDPLYAANDSTSSSGGLITFEPGARSAWHTHPAGQVLIVTSGTGWVQEEGGQKREIKPGDVIWTPPGVKHWHGATATNSMSHIAISNMAGGKNVDWMEQVSDEQYRSK